MIVEWAKFKLKKLKSRLPESERPSWSRLKAWDLRPQTVFDIGVAHGTFQLYRLFPNAVYHLIDPVGEHQMRRLAARLTHANMHVVALGDRDDEHVLFDARDDLQGGTLRSIHEQKEDYSLEADCGRPKMSAPRGS